MHLFIGITDAPRSNHVAESGLPHLFLLLKLPYPPSNNYTDKPKYWQINTGWQGCGYPPELKPEEQQYPKDLQDSQHVGCLASGNTLKANFKIPGRDGSFDVWNLQSIWKPPAAGEKTQQPSVGRAPLPSISPEDNLVHFNQPLRLLGTLKNQRMWLPWRLCFCDGI